jgi:hypothetical protein
MTRRVKLLKRHNQLQVVYKLLLRAETKSEAKILGKHIHHYLAGQNFRVVYKLENIGDQIFPGGFFTVTIQWPNGQFEITTYTIPQLEPRKAKLAEPTSIWGVLCRGFALFFLGDARDKNGQGIIFYKSPDNTISRAASFHSVLGIESEEIYQFYAMIAAVVSLVILVGDKIVGLIMSLVENLLQSGQVNFCSTS